MVKIAQTKEFNNKLERIEYLNKRLAGFSQAQKRESGLSGLYQKKNDELDYIIQSIYKQHLKAVSLPSGKEVIVTTKQADILYKDTPQYQAKVMKSAKNFQKKNKTLGTTNSIIIHLTHYGFTVSEAVWLVNKFGMKMARWRVQVASSEKEEFFDEVFNDSRAIDRYIE